MKTSAKKEYDLVPLFESFISKMRRGKHLQGNGKRISAGTLKNYENTLRLLKQFSTIYNFHLRLRSIAKLNHRELKAEKKYWLKFYHGFSSYLYDDLFNFDNYVSCQLKAIRTFLNYLKDDQLIDTGSFQKLLHIHYEDIQIIVLSPERLKYLIHSRDLDCKLSLRQKEARDFFIFGCTVALRFSDLVRLRIENIEKIGNHCFLSIQSKKTQVFTRVKLPTYAVSIIEKYKKKSRKNLLPHFNLVNLNIYIKEVLEIAEFTEPVIRTRTRRGIPQVMYLNTQKKENYRFCDMATTHTMRRTAITTMLCLGMSEQLVRQISGHAANSKEFYKYVSYSQAYLDQEISKVHYLMENASEKAGLN